MPALDDAVLTLPAPERVGAPSAWALLPGDLAALGPLRGDPERLFSRLQRVADWGAEGPAVGKSARALLAHTDLSLPEIVEAHPSADGATRCVLRTSDGHRIEAVHMPRATRNPRVTLCLSSQIGCAMGCTFCATGTMGIVRNLSAGEIVGTVLALMHRLGPRSGHQLTLVFMGMGEPLHNLAHVARAIEVLHHQRGVGLSPNRVTVSTSGLVPGIDQLGALKVRPLLALSVNATTDEARARLMPVGRAWGLAALKAALLRFPLRHGEKILLEYVLLRGENDSDDDAVRLAELARGLRHNINLIPLNPHDATALAPPDEETVQRFARRVRALGCLCTVRDSRGRDVRGACGQLVQDPARAPRPNPGVSAGGTPGSSPPRTR
ncbi:MAG: 23S rRNA (adenine(2503)-C(2))-methyltransferase RlmN [Deltaproteobacteria bacterium]|nr:23S rRNA (adenine(2503)-C(2))-methyltransferase RlmN [Deltaproteobacteria bacterium]